MKKLLALGAVMIFVVGCGANTKVIRHYPRSIAPAPASPQQEVKEVVYIIAPDPLAEDPVVVKARAVGEQRKLNRARWDRACLELRRADPVYTTYADCRRILGTDKESFSSDGNTGSIFSNSPGIVWR